MEDKKYTVYTHRVVTEDNGPMYYVGITTNTKRRWFPSKYGKDNSLYTYIEKYGWDNIEHSVFADGLDYEMALKLEDTLIRLYRHFDCCINHQRSGLISSDILAYHRYKYANDQEYANCRLQRERDKYANDQEYANRIRQSNREWSSSTEGKIYNRVKKFNYAHPDRVIETPLEAKRKYLETGYIPDYISHNNLYHSTTSLISSKD